MEMILFQRQKQRVLIIQEQALDQQNKVVQQLIYPSKTKDTLSQNKRGKPKTFKKMESPYSSHPKSDHNRSKSSYVKGPKSLKSIFQVYRNNGSTENSAIDQKQTKNVNSSMPIQIGIESFKIGSINFKLNKNQSKKSTAIDNNVSVNSYVASINTRNKMTK